MLLPLSTAGLLIDRPCVCVGPPWSASGVRRGSATSVPPGRGEVTTETRLLAPVMVPLVSRSTQPGSRLEFRASRLLFATMLSTPNTPAQLPASLNAIVEFLRGSARFVYNPP